MRLVSRELVVPEVEGVDLVLDLLLVERVGREVLHAPADGGTEALGRAEEVVHRREDLSPDDCNQAIVRNDLD